MWWLLVSAYAAPVCSNGDCSRHWELCASLEKQQWAVAMECYLSAVNHTEVPCHLASSQRNPYGCLIGYLFHTKVRTEFDDLAAIWRKLEVTEEDVVVAIGEPDRTAPVAIQARVGFGASGVAKGLTAAAARLAEDLTPLVRAGEDLQGADSRLTELDNAVMRNATIVYFLEPAASDLTSVIKDLQTGTVVVVEDTREAKSRAALPEWAGGCYPGLFEVSSNKLGNRHWTFFLKAPAPEELAGKGPRDAMQWKEPLESRVTSVIDKLYKGDLSVDSVAPGMDPRSLRLATLAEEPQPPEIDKVFAEETFRKLLRSAVIGNVGSAEECALRQIAETGGLSVRYIQEALAEVRLQDSEVVTVLHSVTAAAASALKQVKSVNVLPGSAASALQDFPLKTKPTPAQKVDEKSTVVIMGKGAPQDFLADFAKTTPQPVEVCLPDRECYTRQHRWILSPDLLPSTPGVTFIKEIGHGASALYLYASTDPNDDDATIIF
jgi:hypothetical protein